MKVWYKSGGYLKYKETGVDNWSHYFWNFSVANPTIIKSSGPTPGFPAKLGKTNLTTSLDGTEMLSSRLPSASCFSKAYAFEGVPDWFVGGEVAGNVPMAASFSLDFEDFNMYERTAVKLRAAIYDAQVGMQGGVFLAEFKQVYGMLRNPIRAMRNLTEGFVAVLQRILREHRDIRRKPEFARKWSKAWLEYSYGMKPLAADLQSLLERLNQISEKRLVTKIRVTESDYRNAIDVNDYILSAGFSGSAKRAQTWTSRGSGVACVNVLPAGPKFDLDNFGFRFLDIVPTAWELIPFSFLAGYFSNFEQLVKCSFIESSSVVWNWVGVEDLVELYESYGVGADLPMLIESRASITPAVIKRRRVKRTVLDEHNYAFSVSFSPSLGQIANMSALIGALVKLRSK